MKNLRAVRIEGGLFSPDLLEQLDAENLPGQKPAHFGFKDRAEMTSTLAALFNEARTLWTLFQQRRERLRAGESDTSITRRWMTDLLELLGYTLTLNRTAYQLGGGSFAISHRAGDAEFAPPVHLVGASQPLDRSDPNVQLRRAPHTLLQEFLNRSDALWGIVSNGLTLRLLRDSARLRKLAYVEFDLQAIFEGQQFDAFVLLFRLLHRSRLPESDADAPQCLLEQYYQHAIEQGGRVREKLRDGVERALVQLANGFLRWGEWRMGKGEWGMANSEWGMANGEGRLEWYDPAQKAWRPIADSPHHLYQQLLRLVYRFLFLLTAEERGLILTPDSPQAQQLYTLYMQHYSVSRLRRLCEQPRARTPHTDLWRSLQALWLVFREPQYAQRLGVAPLNGDLFREMPLEHAVITNQDLLSAFESLVFYEDETRARRPVNYAALDVEELGSVYESLLELQPVISEWRMASGRMANGEGRMANGEGRMANGEGRIAKLHFEFEQGTERRSTGSYYTPPELVYELIESALKPAVENAVQRALALLESDSWELIGEVANSEVANSEMANSEYSHSPFATSPFANPPFATSPFATSPFATSPFAIPHSPFILRYSLHSKAGKVIPLPNFMARWIHDGLVSGLSRPRSVAERDAGGGTGLSSDAELPGERTVRLDQPDAPSRDLDPSEHRGGLGTTLHSGVHPVPAESQRQPHGAGNPPDPEQPREPLHGTGSATPPHDAPQPGTPTEQPGTQPPQQTEPLTPPSPFAIPPSPLRHSLTSPSPFAIPPSPLRHSLTSPSPFAHSLFAQLAILHLKVLDPACGSGHFLLAAARYLGKELARRQHPNTEPSPQAIRDATREVIRQCIYGVDKNPLAVELCKVALWIESHTPGKPLTFLDHHIRCGDSLVGVFDLEVLSQGVPDDAYKPLETDNKTVAREARRRNTLARAGQLSLNDEPPARLTLAARALAEQLHAIPDDTPAHIEAKAHLLEQIHQDDHWQRLRLACDLYVAALLQPLDNPANVITSEHILRALHGEPVPETIRARAEALAHQYRCFHWALEFPEVLANGELANSEMANREQANSEYSHSPFAPRHSPFALHHSPFAPSPFATRHSPFASTPGFDVILGNPPYLGGLKISGTLGAKYRHYLEIAYAPFGGTADLCAAFFRRGYQLLRPGGYLGMVATNTIGQGDTRESGLAVIVQQGGIITHARQFIKWPGAASVEVNLVALHRPDGTNTTHLKPVLNGQRVEFISSRLTEEPEKQAQTLRFEINNRAFIGDFVRGMGFILEPEEAGQLLKRVPKHADCLYRYLNGEDLNSHPEHQPSRWVICFHDWTLEAAARYPELLKIVEERVKPERERLHGPGDKRNREYWWQYGAYRAGMRRAIAPLARVLVRAQTTDAHALVFLEKEMIFSHMLIVFAFEDYYHYTILQSNIHEFWVRRQSCTLGAGLRYTPTDCFQTFPFPPEEYRRPMPPGGSAAWLADAPEPFRRAAQVGEAYYLHRQALMRNRWIGLTETYNLFHNPDCQDADIQQLRALHQQLDESVLACYGWSDLDLAHGFHPDERGRMRFTPSPAAKRELLKRLLALNLQLAQEEAQGRSSAWGRRR